MPRVLLVDDSEAIRASLGEALEDEGWTVDAAATPAQALALAAAEPPVVVLLDLLLPGMDGAVLARQLREAGCRAPVLVLSADRGGAERARAAGAAGAAAFLQKPFDLEVLLGAMARATGGTQPP
jgi:two-component system OmpR family response regulator